ncbi:hypothetical protein RND71_019297 [Anisodus tanguticus]|uniref:Uncharacterized protein n=1 Tax=Anisodus tanguticus TaxID=243964 RepID=A0AAE1RZ41_9SOLA|nr:hypothetical protein RND71_019297 [Anisodus tanguticus]
MVSSLSCKFHANPNLTLPSQNMVASATGQPLLATDLYKEIVEGATKEIHDATNSGDNIIKDKSNTIFPQRYHGRRFPVQKYLPKVLLSGKVVEYPRVKHKESFGDYSTELQASVVSPTKSWVDRMDEEKHEDVIIKDIKVFQLGMEEGLSEVEDNNVTDEGLIDTSVGVLISSGIIELIMVVDKASVDGGLDTLGMRAMSQVLKDEQMHDLTNDVENETYVKGHISPVKKDRINPDMIADKDDLIDNSIDGSSPNNVLHDLVSHIIVNLNIGKKNINLDKYKEESILQNFEKEYKQASIYPKFKSNNKGQKKGGKTVPIEKQQPNMVLPNRANAKSNKC